MRDAQGRTRLARVDPDRLRQLATTGGGRLSRLQGLPSLLADLRSGSALGRQSEREEGIEVAHWRDGGVWLLPVLLLGVAGMARRGWL